MRIRFLTDQIYETVGPGQGLFFPAGYVLDEADVGEALRLVEVPTPEYARGFLNRWIQRKVAEAVDEDVLPSIDKIEMTSERAAAVVQQPLGTATRGKATKGTDDGKPVKKADYDNLTRAELDKLAGKRGLNVSEAKNKGDVIAALVAADAAENG